MGLFPCRRHWATGPCMPGMIGRKENGCPRFFVIGGGMQLIGGAWCSDRRQAIHSIAIGCDRGDFGQWFTPLREALDAFVNRLMEPVSGTCKLKLYKGNVIIGGRTSPNTLYRPDLASFTMGASYDQRDAAGFINIFGLPMKVQALAQKR